MDVVEEDVGESATIVCEFLEVAFHLILYMREVYPSAIFERRRKYGVAVRVSRHPELYDYIAEVVRGLHAVLRKGDVHKVVLAILDSNKPNAKVIERFVFEISVLMNIGKDDKDAAVLEEELRTFLVKINIVDAMLKKNPKGCTFRILLYTNEYDPATQLWVPVDSAPQQEVSNAALLPLKSMDTRVVQMQLFVEESKVKA